MTDLPPSSHRNDVTDSYVRHAASVSLTAACPPSESGPSVDLSPSEVARVLARFINQSVTPAEWHRFLDQPIRDPALESIREQAKRLGGASPIEIRLAMMQVYARAQLLELLEETDAPPR